MPTITVVDKPGSTPSIGNPLSKNAQSAREKAISALIGGGQGSSPGEASQATQVQNPSQISAEETTNLNSAQALADASQGRSDNQVETQSESTEEPVSTKEATQPEQEEQPLSSQYAVLARKEKALRAKEQSFKAREAALSAKEAELSNSQPSSVDKSKYIAIDDLKRNALGKLQELGLSYDDLSAQALQSQSPEFQALRQLEEKIDAKLQKLESEQAKVSKTFEDQQSQAYKGALNQIKIETTALVNSDPAFETIKEMNAAQDVVDLIEKTFQDDGTLMTVEEAAALVEEHLTEEAFKYSQLKKVQERLKKSAQPKPAQQPAPQAQQQQPMKTLTNGVGSTRQLTARERAILAAKGELK